MQYKIGDKFKSKIDNHEFEIVDIDPKDNLVWYVCNNQKRFVSRITFERCLVNLEKIN